MKLSKRTIEILKNFSAISANLYFKAGSTLSTLAVNSSVMAKVEVDEKFPMDAGVFNLSELLGALSLFNDPDVDFAKTHLVIKEGKSKIEYTYADESILTYPKKDLKLPSEDVVMNISAAQLTQMLKTAAVLGVQDIAFSGDGKKIVAKVLDKKNPTGNTLTIDLGIKSAETFDAYFKLDNFKMINDDYTVTLCKKNIGMFVGAEWKMTYFVAVEQDATWS